MESPNRNQRTFLTRVLDRRKRLSDSSKAPKWALLNSMAACVVLAVIANNRDLKFISLLYLLLLILIINVILDAYKHFFPVGFNAQDLALNARQMQLLQVDRTDPGFKLSPDNKTAKEYKNPFNPPLDGSFICKQNASVLSNVSMTSMSPHQLERSQNASHFESPANSGKLINDERSLNEYLDNFKLNQSQNGASFIAAASPNNSTMDSSSFFKTSPPSLNQSQNHHQILDNSSLLSKLKYQLSSSLPEALLAKAKKEAEKSPMTAKEAKKEDICYRINIDPLTLVSWNEKLRMWISQTVLVRLIEEIDETNQQLSKLGVTDAIIGVSALEKVKKASQMGQILHHIPTLTRLTPFLELNPNQEYLVKRIRELSSGGAMGEYRWNGGGPNWSPDKLPTDAELVMHCLVCYLDARLPPLKGVVDGKVFSTLYFSKDPKKLENEAGIKIIQTSTKPPNFVVQIGSDEKLELSPGRNNLFYTLLYFLHQIKTVNHGILGRINMGRSGLNILWVIE